MFPPKLAHAREDTEKEYPKFETKSFVFPVATTWNDSLKIQIIFCNT